MPKKKKKAKKIKSISFKVEKVNTKLELLKYHSHLE